MKEHFRLRLKRERKSVQESRLLLEKEYTDKWISWRKYLLDHDLLEDDEDDEVNT